MNRRLHIYRVWAILFNGKMGMNGAQSVLSTLHMQNISEIIRNYFSIGRKTRE